LSLALADGDVPRAIRDRDQNASTAPSDTVIGLTRKGPAEIGVKAKYRGEVAKERQRQRQHDADRPDRGGPQGRKDKDFQRKF